ncbi:NAD(P)-dependent dehydrogenase, short-chain alcohol dehydrogenase family [Natribacillus halophilus]|uniref:NAD(P)-dependent dehydrogenase, short-chain alcohol dehydrogenase family n=1 Tax=Natribacillus halophilus TaxID=549003 RepID=A0A1G8LLK7_9BACI|nr:SDR family oxidoreductase [Natribacillus halophilus]SDI56556.1 NAD(P)-dependent dehydrogenase, short-chain alcohol dehydrogenase family [Natribacillus halophilus]
MGSQGVKLLLLDFNEKTLDKTVDEVKRKGIEAHGFLADVSKAEDVKRYVKEAKEKFGRIDFFHNNAGILQKPSLLHGVEEAEFDQVMAVNLKGAFLGLKYVLEMMAQQQSGSIVNGSSHAGIRAEPYLGVYGATKHALAGMTLTAANEYGSQGIRVNAVCPGAVKTTMTDGMVDDSENSSPMQRTATADEIASVVSFLFSDEASYVNGVVMPVDGGLAV